MPPAPVVEKEMNEKRRLFVRVKREGDKDERESGKCNY